MGIKPKPNRTEEPRTIAKRPHLAENVCQLSSSEFLADFMSPSTPEVSTENEFDAYLLLSNNSSDVLHRVSKNVPPLACYNFDALEWILICFGRNVTNKVGNQKTLYYVTSNNLWFCTTCQNGETWKSHFSLNSIVLNTQCTCALSSWKNKLSSVMYLIASDIYWDSKISH